MVLRKCHLKHEKGIGVKKPTKSNMYLDAKLEQLAAFDAAIDGDVDADVCIVGFGRLPDQVLSALRAACAGIGMPDPVVVDASQLAEPANATYVLEALDPAAVIMADEVAAEMVGDGYHAKLPLNAPVRLLGRPVVAFESFQADLADDKLKQRDWALLKTLKRK